MPRPRLFVLVVLALSLSVVAFGCKSGGGKKSPTPTSATASPTAADLTPLETPAGAQALPFDSFHYTVDLSIKVSQPGKADESFISGNVEGDYVAPDSHAYKDNFALGTLTGSDDIVIIGQDAWIRQGQGEWKATTRDASEIASTTGLTSADPTFLAAGDLAGSISALKSENETINGVDTRRYHVPKEAVQTLKDLLGPDFLSSASGLQEFEMTVWLDKATDGLVRAELNATADPSLLGGSSGLNLPAGSTASVSMKINLTKINDNSISIKPPI